MQNLKLIYNQRVGLINCKSKFLSNTTMIKQVRQDLMPNLLHPNAEGYRILSHCILKHINNEINNHWYKFQGSKSREKF